MPFFIYKVKNSNGSVQKGCMHSNTKEALYTFLQKKNMQLIYAYEPHSFLLQFFSQNEKLLFLKSLFFSLHQLLSAQIPLMDALTLIAQQTTTLGFKKILYELIFNLEQGDSLSQALDKQNAFFGRIVVQEIIIAEASSTHVEAFKKLSTYFDWKISVRTKVTEALRYPVFLLIFVFFMIVGLNTYLLPDLIDFLKSNDMQSDSITTWLYLQDMFSVFSTAVLLLLYVMLFQKKNKVLSKFLKKLHALLFFKLQYEKEIANFLNTLGLLLENNSDIETAFNLASEDVRLPYIKEDLDQAKNLIIQGNPLSGALNSVSFLDPFIVRFLHLGEKSGTVDKNLILCSEILYNRFYGKVETLIQIIQPTLILGAGLLILWIVSIFILPIYDVLSKGGLS